MEQVENFGSDECEGDDKTWHGSGDNGGMNGSSAGGRHGDYEDGGDDEDGRSDNGSDSDVSHHTYATEDERDDE